jgi:CHAT domain-containing protein
VILVNPHLAREYRGGVRPLPALREAEEEGKTVGAFDPSAVLIAGDSATKQNLTRLWGDAPYLYVAAHTVAGVPYIAALVLAEPAGDRAPDETVLDVTDIRAADLTRCRVVVLSGCSSGSPYVAAKGAAPSLGDAFLDAGAVAVVHTFWDVQDEDARRIGTSFIEKRTAAKTGDIRALSDARRSEIRGPLGVRHPSRWAAYAITVSRL